MNRPLTVTIPHNLGAAEARRRIDTGLAELLAKLPGQGEISHSWEGDRMNFAAGAMGQSITGFMRVLDNAVELEVLLPGFLGMIAGKIRGEIERKGQILLEAPKK